MGSRLSGWNLFPVDRYSKRKIIAGTRVELSPAQMKETTYYSFWRSRRSLQLYIPREAPWRSKGSDVNLPIGLFTRIHLG